MVNRGDVGRFMPVRFAGMALVLLLLPRASAADRAEIEALWREAATKERQQQWREAADAYWKLLRHGDSAPNLRQRYLHCLRRVRLLHRHSDPVFRQHVRDLPLSKTAVAYTDALALIQSQFVDRVDVATLFRLGLEELEFALREDVFRRAYAPLATETQWSTVLAELRASWGNAHPGHVDDARSAVRTIALSIQRSLGIKPSVVVMEFLCGACNGLDEHSGYRSPSEEQAHRAIWLSSIGLILEPIGTDMWLVERVASGSWAADADIRGGDRLCFRPSTEPRDDSTSSGEIEVESPGGSGIRRVKLPPPLPSVLEDEFHMDGIGVVRISSFQPTTPVEFDRLLARWRMLGLKALVIDLRGNPGGSLLAAIQLAERFLPSGTLLITQGQNPAFNRTWESHSGLLAVDLPLIVLIDGETASAAEVLAGALKEHQRARLVGSPTFGKGTMQHVWPIADGGTLRLTLARLFGPRGLPYQGLGVIPDIHEPLRPKEAALDLARSWPPWP